jgi:copper(I)-binding protein
MKKLAFSALVCLAVLTACGGKTITVSNAVMRKPLGSNTTTVLYLDVANTGKTDDAIVSVKVDGAGSVEADETAMDEHNVMQMRPIQGNVPLPAGQTVEFKPMQKHFMVTGVTQKFNEGDHANVTLTFEHAAPVTVAADVKMMP